MKNCMGCKYAEWYKTKSGRLHPNGEGKCLFEFKIPTLPACKYFVGGSPCICGGVIERKKDFKTDCAYYQGGNYAEKID